MKSDQGRGSDEERAYVKRRCKDSKMSLWNFRGAERKLGRAGQSAAVFERGGVRSLRLGSSFHLCLARPAESPERQNGDRTTLLRVSPTLALTSCSAVVFLKNQFQKKGIEGQQHLRPGFEVSFTRGFCRVCAAQSDCCLCKSHTARPFLSLALTTLLRAGALNFGFGLCAFVRVCVSSA